MSIKDNFYKFSFIILIITFLISAFSFSFVFNGTLITSKYEGTIEDFLNDDSVLHYYISYPNDVDFDESFVEYKESFDVVDNDGLVKKYLSEIKVNEINNSFPYKYLDGQAYTFVRSYNTNFEFRLNRECSIFSIEKEYEQDIWNRFSSVHYYSLTKEQGNGLLNIFYQIKGDSNND